MNEKLSIATLNGGTRVAVLHLNGSAGFLQEPREDLLSNLFNTLDLPDHPGSPVEPLTIASEDINRILGIEKPNPEDEAKLTAALLSRDTADIATSAGLVPARGIQFSLGRTPMVAALVNLARASTTYQIPTRLLIITDYPDLPLN